MRDPRRKSTGERSAHETDTDRLRRSMTPEAISASLVSAFAGDRAMTPAETAFLRDYQREAGEAFYSDLLYVISHQYFAPEVARKLWAHLVSHRDTMTKALGRNVYITVAALDYMSNVSQDLTAATLISEEHLSQLANLSMRDGMTGLYNHTSCYELLDLEFRLHRRYGMGVALILVDIDDFKRINDLHGHLEGDRVLKAVACTVSHEVRDSDICCRFGGEEFAAILPFTNSAKDACEIAERIRARSAQIRSVGNTISVSAGVALSDPHSTSPGALIDKADRALYRAKRNGKNQVAS